MPRVEEGTRPTADWQSAERHAHPLAFRLLDVGAGARRSGHDTGWRRLPTALFETPEGGSWDLWLEGRKSPVRVNPGEVAVVPAEVMHRLHVPGPRTLKTLFLVARFEAFTGLDVIGLSRIPPRLTGAVGQAVARDMKKILALRNAARTRVDACARMHALGFAILAQALRQADEPEFAPPIGLKQIEAALAHVHENLTAPLTRSRLAAVVGLSPARFHSVFKQATGMAPMLYVRTQRLQRARELLIRTGRAVYEIAEACGFSSTYYFCRIFRQYVGQTPSRFRNAFRPASPSRPSPAVCPCLRRVHARKS
ncbi:MAG: helix-turn-helix transcriptional regulator [Kiritimatiellae bacterium]|nr:helix-turn-helix transcriptional regulator [Kiritimatiellia bacterium]